MKSVTLYAKDVSGKLRVWSISQVMLDSEYYLDIEHGLEDGEKTGTLDRVHINESGRSIIEQMNLQMKSRINKKLDAGYSESRESAMLNERTNAIGLPRPMKAKEFEPKRILNRKHLVIQKKYNGHRCLIAKRDDQLIAYSRNGKIIDSIGHILEGVEAGAMSDGEVLDGELYIHGMSLQKISSLVRKFQPDSRKLIYICYDAISNNPEDGWFNRMSASRSIEKSASKHLAIAEWIHLKNLSHLDALEEISGLHNMFTSVGYEGTIIRNAESPYEQGKRSFGLLKKKNFTTDEFQIVAIAASRTGAAIFCCSSPGGDFDVLAPGGEYQKAEFLRNPSKVVGRMLTVKYAEKTDAGKPFHPIAIEVRYDT